MIKIEHKHNLYIDTFNNYIDPDIINVFLDVNVRNINKIDYSYTCIIDKNKYHYIKFLLELTSNILNNYNIFHQKEIWFIDIINYNIIDNDKIDSGLAIHCEDDNGYELVSVLFYIRKDKTIIDGDLIYLDKNKEKKKITINDKTTIIMDGRIYHQPEIASGNGIRQVIIISFVRKKT